MRMNLPVRKVPVKTMQPPSADAAVYSGLQVESLPTARKGPWSNTEFARARTLKLPGGRRCPDAPGVIALP